MTRQPSGQSLLFTHPEHEALLKSDRLQMYFLTRSIWLLTGKMNLYWLRKIIDYFDEISLKLPMTSSVAFTLFEL